MIKALLMAALSAITFSATASGDYQCGMYQVTVVDGRSVKVNGKPIAIYQFTEMNRFFDYLHQFGVNDNRIVIRETQKGRVAMMIPGETRWNACQLVLMGFEK